MNGLLAPQWASHIADIIAVGLLLIMTLIGAKKGFIKSFFGMISTIGALIVAILFAKRVLAWTDGLFGLQDFFDGKLSHAFSKLNGFDADVSAGGVDAALENKNMPALIARLVMKFADTKELAAGTTLAQVVGETLSRLACIAITAVLLFIVVKILLSIVKRILDRWANGTKTASGLNTFGGAVFGLVKGLMIICLLLFIVTLIPTNFISNYIEKTVTLETLYNYNPWVWLLGLLL